jgi:hypothetical protein
MTRQMGCPSPIIHLEHRIALAPAYLQSDRLPRGEEREAATRKIPGVAGGYPGAGDPGGGGDLGVEGLDGTAFPPASSTMSA